MRLPSEGHGPPGGGPGGIPARRPVGPATPAAINAPPIVLGLIAVLVAIHCARMFLPVEVDNLVIVWGAFWPARYDALPGQLADGGWNDIAAFTSTVTYGFLHGSWTHIGLNCIWLLAFGTPVARRLGPARFLLFYIACGIAGVALFLSVHWGEIVPVIGASASISGLTGGVARLAFRRNRHPGDVTGPLANLSERGVVIFVLMWFGVNVVFGLAGIAGGERAEAIAWEAHVGGFLLGILVFPFLDRPTLDRPSLADPFYRRRQQ